GSAQKRIPEFAFGAGDSCVAALLRAYFEGDGNVSVDRGPIRVSSNSAELTDGVALLLRRLGIVARKGQTGTQYTLWIPHRYAAALRTAIGFESKETRASLDRPGPIPSRRCTYDGVE